MENNNRLIRPGDLIATLRDDPDINGKNFARIKRHIDNAPTMDAVPVVHGRWILKSRIYKMFDDVDEEFYVECNLCNREEPVCFEFGEQQMLDYAKRHYPYCHCGAKMDGGNEDV